MVAITSAAFSVDALYGDLVYRVPEDSDRRRRVGRVRYVVSTSVDPPAAQLDPIATVLAQTFRLRDIGVHAYTQVLPVEPHPAGFSTGRENAYFNAVTAAAAVDAARDLIRLVRDKPGTNSSVRRWQTARSAYFARVEVEEASRAALPPVVPAAGWTLPKELL